MWGDEEYYGLGYEFDPVWFLTDEDQALETGDHRRLPAGDPAAGDRVPTGRGDYPRASVDELARLRLLAMIAPERVRVPRRPATRRC